MEAIKLEHLPDSYVVYVALFRNLQNAEFLHKQLLDRNSDFEYAFIDASIVLSRFQLLTAVFKAGTASVTNTLKTPNIHSETVTSLSSSNNISEAYRRYGISPTTKDLIIVKIAHPTESRPEPASAESIWAHVKQNVQGEAVPFTDENIAQITDLAKVQKYYKLNGLNWLGSISDGEAKRREMEQLVVSGMALRGV